MKKSKIGLTTLAISLMFSVFLPYQAKAAQSPVGTLVSSNGAVYMVLETFKRPYPSAVAFKSYYFNSWTNVKTATKEDVSMKDGDFIPPREGSIICSDQKADKGACYLISSGKKLLFANAKVFTEYGLSFKTALTGDISYVPAGDIITAVAAHLPGTLINKSGTIYIVGKNGIMGIPSRDVLNSWGYDFKDAVKANAVDNSLSFEYSLFGRAPNQLVPSELVIPPALNLTNDNKFSLPFAESNVVPKVSEGWFYSNAEHAIHGYTYHGAVDFDQPRNTPVYASADGYAISSTHLAPTGETYQGKEVGFGLGEFVEIWHPNQGVYTTYSHLSKVDSKIPYFKPECHDDGSCDPKVLYNSTDYVIQNGQFVKRGQLIGYVGDSGLSWGYNETPRVQRDPIKEPSWDATHLHFEVFTRSTTSFGKANRYDPFAVYGREDQYSALSFTNPNSLWMLNSNNRPVFAK